MDGMDDDTSTYVTAGRTLGKNARVAGLRFDVGRLKKPC
jgi:hypothetical protein